MKITNVETKEQLKELYDCSAMTWEGLNTDEGNLKAALEACCVDGVDGEIFITKGNTMNEICGLTGSNAYPDDLTIVSIKKFKGLAIMVGARWMDDIVDNNARREEYHPFEE